MPNEHATTVADALCRAETLLAGLGAATAFDWKQGFVCMVTTWMRLHRQWKGLCYGQFQRNVEEQIPFCRKIQAQIANGVPRKRVGISEWPTRQGAKIMSADGTEEIGTITMNLQPCLKKPVAMGYINVPHHKSGTDIMIDKGRGKLQEAKVTKMPFVPSNYKR